MQIRSFPIRELIPEQAQAWSQLQCADPAYDSPFFRPEYSQLAAEVWTDAEVAVVENAGQPVAFWPFIRHRCAAVPVGESLCDFQGVVAQRDLPWNPAELLRACRLHSWSFDHVPAAQHQVAPYGWLRVPSPCIDAAAGYDAYCRQKRESGSATLRETLRKMRKLEREVGPLRFVPHSPDRRLFNAVIDWKRAQYRRIGSVDHLADSARRDFLWRVAQYQERGFAGMLSALFAGPHLVGVHLGIRSNAVLHAWFPTFNRDFERYSPGLIFWIRFLQEAESLGIQRIDLGRGDERYKQSLKTGDTMLLEGAVDVGRIRGTIRKTRWAARQFVRNSPAGPPLRAAVHFARALKHRLAAVPSGRTELTAHPEFELTQEQARPANRDGAPPVAASMPPFAPPPIPLERRVPAHVNRE